MSKKTRKTGHAPGKQELHDRLIAIFRMNPARHYNYRQLARQLGLKEMNARRLVVESLAAMKEDDLLDEPSTGAFALKRAAVHVTGIIDLTARGTAYLVSDEVKEDVFIPRAGLKHALNGDKVRVVVHARDHGRRLEGEVAEILERGKETFVGILQLSRDHAFLVPSGKQLPCNIYIPPGELNGARNGEKVVVKITGWTGQQKNPAGSVIKVLGVPGNNDTEMNAIMAEFDLPATFSPAAMLDASRIREDIDPAETGRRRDFRQVTTFTIDPSDAKDFDDALSFRALENGRVEVGVHIADVSHYVRPGTLLDNEARERATSVYLVDRVIPMLPERLSNELCSLRPGEDKLCFSVVFEMDDRAGVLSRWFGRTVIRSARRFTYEEAQAMIDGGEGDFKREITALDALARRLREERFRAGAIDFDRPEARFEVDADGKPTRVYFKRSGEANKLVEEFMLLANRSVAERVGKPGGGEPARTFVYRVHDEPDPGKLADFNRFIAKFGYRLQSTTPKSLSTSMNKLLEEVKEHPGHGMIEMLAIRTMAKAIYSTANHGHHGLAFDYYTHFTSPIRRYPDVMVHRLLARYLDKGLSVNEATLEECCKHCSNMEQAATNAERASIKYKQVEFLAGKVGETFHGTISGVTRWGFHVELDETLAEGFIAVTGLEDDYYEFDEKNYRIVGRRHRKVYQLGDPVVARLDRANLAARQLDFSLATATARDSSRRDPAPRPGRNARRGRRGDEVNPRKTSRGRRH